ncbi:MAG: ABC transporter ATP-binding protein [Thermodesulfobacteriota bacterium]
MKAPLLEVEGLNTRLFTADGVVRAVDGLSFSLQTGETFALLGESGCGKTMAALSIMRLLPETGMITGGRVRLNGTDLLRLPEMEMRKVRGRRIGMIFQEPMLSLNPVVTVGSQVTEVLLHHFSLSRGEAEGRALEMLEAVGLPEARRRKDYYPFQFSGGMKQRVMAAMALACGPDLLIADEPTTALDVTIQAQVLDLLRNLQAQKGMAVLLITHDLGVVAEMAQRVAVMYAGEVVETADRALFFTRPSHPYSQKLFASMPLRDKRGQALSVIQGNVPSLAREFPGCRFAERCEKSRGQCFREPPPWIETAPGQGVRCHLFALGAEGNSSAFSVQCSAFGVKPENQRLAGELFQDERDTGYEIRDTPIEGGHCTGEQGREEPPTLLLVEGLKVYFPIRKGLLKKTVGQVKAVDGVSLSIRTGRTLALVGESGCGKTTLGKGILRLIPMAGGSVSFEGRELALLGAERLRSLRKSFQIIFQDPYASLNPRLRVVEIIEEGMSALGVGKTREERLYRIDRLLEEVGLSPEIKFRYPHEFSGGQRQRIAIARALSVEPKLIVCDEPTSALDISVQAQILNLLKDLQEKHKLGYLFITHNISVVEYLAHEVAVMYLGRVVEQGTVDELLDHPGHPYTRALLSAVPTIDPKTRREVIRLVGDLPSPAAPPDGCFFHPRCPEVMAVCRDRYPGKSMISATRYVHCHLYGERE